MIEKAKFPIYSFINGFEETSFQSVVLKAHHRSLYYYLVFLAGSELRGKTTFTITCDEAMRRSKIGNHRTYKKALIELQSEKLIKYTPGKNGYQAAVIELTIPNRKTAKLLTEYKKGRKKIDRQNRQGKKEIDRQKCPSQIGKSALSTAYILNDINDRAEPIPDEKAFSQIRYNPNPAN